MAIFGIVLPMQAGSTISENSRKKSSESEKWDPNHVGDVKISPKWGRIHGDVIKRMLDASFKSPKEATCSRNAHICNVFLGPAWGGMERIKGEIIELQSGRAEKHDQNRLKFGRFDVEKVRFFFKML